MKYWDRSREIAPDDISRDPVLKQSLRHPYLLKSQEYEYEKEVRLTTVNGRACPTLVVEGVRPEDWIREIRISPDIWHEDAGILRDLISARCPKLAECLRHSPLSNSPSNSKMHWSKIEANLAQKDSEENWPDFLHEP